MKTEYKFRTQHQYITPENAYEETTDSISETVPNQSHSITEILVKFQNGTLGNIAKQNPYYETEDDFDSYDPTEAPDFDLVDAENHQNYIRQNAQKLADIKARKEENKTELSTNKTEKTSQSEDTTNKLNEQ